MRIGGRQFTVIGVLANRGVSGVGDADNQILVPFTTGRFQLFGTDRIQDIWVRATNDAVLEDGPRRLKMRWPDVGVLELAARTPSEAPDAFPRPRGEAAYVYRRPADIGDGWTTASARDTGMRSGTKRVVMRFVRRGLVNAVARM